MAKSIKDLDAQIKEVQDNIEKGKIYLDKGLLLIEDLEGQIQANKKQRDATKKARSHKSPKPPI